MGSSTGQSMLRKMCGFALLTGGVFGFGTGLPDESFTGEGAHLDGLPPYFLGGATLDLRNYVSNAEARIAPHTADGPGLHLASAGHPSSFTIRLGGDGNGTAPEGEWDIGGKHFIYVSLVSTDHVLSAVVEDNGDGSLTATYDSPFPGEYFVFVQEVDVREHFRHEEERAERARPIRGSPFSLSITGDPTIDVRELDVCDTQGHMEDLSSSFWRKGSWVTSKYASAEHGVLRDGWVFQPNDCVYDTFSHGDIMLLASMEEPTWLLVVGNSIQRGLFQTLVDLVLVAGQKNEFATSVVKKCWGIADVQIGNLRLTYQDLRLYEIERATEDSVVCHDYILATNSTAEYITSSERFFEQTIFKDGEPWPTVIVAPSHMVDTDEAANPQINVLLEALPDDWDGNLIMLEHMAGLGFFFEYENPTARSVVEAKPKNQAQQGASADNGLRRMETFHSQEPRLTFMSVFPMYQSRMFDGELSRPGKPCFGCTAHYHYVLDPESPQSWDGAVMVHSDISEMLANILISKAVGTKAALYEKAASLVAADEPKPNAHSQFQVCTDCPADLLPFHVKAVPDLTCVTETHFPGHAALGKAWGGKNCPQWCHEEEISYVLHDFLGVRICSLEDNRS